MMSTRSMTPRSSCEPRPRAPMNPVAWESSTITRAPCRSARAQISCKRAIDPSMENTPSVAIRRTRAFCESLSACSSSFMSLLA